MKKITKRTVQRSSKPKAEDENYFSMSAKCFVRAFLFLTLGMWNFAKRIYDRLPKIAVLTISFMLVTLLFVVWLKLPTRTLKRALQRLFGSVIVYS